MITYRDLFDDRRPVSYELPPASPCRICYWGGGDSSPDIVTSNQSQNTILTGRMQALESEEQMLQRALAQIAPWQAAGSSALGQLSGLLGVPGYTYQDPTQVLISTPGYQFLQNQGTQALARYGAATGLGASGAAMKSALNYGQNLAQTYAWQPYMSALQNLSGQGLQAGGLGSGNIMQTGLAEASTYGRTAEQLAGLQAQDAQLQMKLAMQNANSQNSWLNDLMGGLGFAGNLALAPFTGGTSLIGAGVGALGNLLGGASGGGTSLTEAPGMSLGQLYSGFGGSTQAFNPSSGGGWVPAGTTLLADGGPVMRGLPYIVGERGPELIYPRDSGYVIPNHLLEYSAFSRA